VSAPPGGEDQLLAWLRERLGPGSLLGDDTALLPAAPAGARWVATVDSQIAGIHHPADLDPALVARRLLAVNLSDLAAAGADPAYGLLALAAPAGYDHRRFLAAFTAAAAAHGVTLAGGDLARSPERTVATLTLLGLLPAGRTLLARGAGRPGDALWLAGGLGASAAGRLLLARGARAAWADGVGAEGESDSSLVIDLPPSLPPGLADAAHRSIRRHLAPLPQLALGRALSEVAGGSVEDVGGGPVAAIDVSDGLALDLARLCRESGTGAEVEVERLPVAGAAAELAPWLGADALDLALHGGEDYALLFTLPPAAAPPAGSACAHIGRLTAGPDLVLLVLGERRPLAPEGWDHLLG
jgi:thiamine-monophosphate kinase